MSLNDLVWLSQGIALITGVVGLRLARRYVQERKHAELEARIATLEAALLQDDPARIDDRYDREMATVHQLWLARERKEAEARALQAEHQALFANCEPRRIYLDSRGNLVVCPDREATA